MSRTISHRLVNPLILNVHVAALLEERGQQQDVHEAEEATCLPSCRHTWRERQLKLERSVNNVVVIP